MPFAFQPFDPHGTKPSRIVKIPLRLIVPNLITVLAICCGISGIRLAFEEHFETAVITVLLAAFLDGIDGRIARILKATSKFGAHMDSLADIVNFGVAPALVLYLYLLKFSGAFGWIAVLVFVIACALRLARFNVLDEDSSRPSWKKDYFVGVPAPLGAVLLLLPVYLGFLGVPLQKEWISLAGTFFTLFIAFLLVSRLPVYSGKKCRIRRDTVIPVILGTVIFSTSLIIYPWGTLTVFALLYLMFLPWSAKTYLRDLRTYESDSSQI